MGIFSRPSVPAPPPPPPPAPPAASPATMADASVVQAGANTKAGAAAAEAAGADGTIATSPQGLKTPPTTAGTTLLGATR